MWISSGIGLVTLIEEKGFDFRFLVSASSSSCPLLQRVLMVLVHHPWHQ